MLSLQPPRVFPPSLFPIHDYWKPLIEQIRTIFNFLRTKSVAWTLKDSSPLQLSQKRGFRLDSEIAQLGEGNPIVHVKLTVPTLTRVKTTIKNAQETISFNFCVYMCTSAYVWHDFEHYWFNTCDTSKTCPKRFCHLSLNLEGRCFLSSVRIAQYVVQTEVLTVGTDSRYWQWLQ